MQQMWDEITALPPQPCTERVYWNDPICGAPASVLVYMTAGGGLFTAVCEHHAAEARHGEEPAARWQGDAWRRIPSG